MSTNETTIAAFGPGQARQLLGQFVLSQAAELGRSGSYDSAESLLKQLVHQPDAPAEALDLQAKICAQQGRMRESERWWQKVLDREPSNAAAQAALARLNRMERRPAWLRIVWPLLAGLGTLACVSLLFAWQTRWQVTANSNLQQRVAEVVKEESRIAQQQVQGLLTEVQVLRSNQAEAKKSLAELGDFGAKLGGWQATQSALSERVKDLQGEAKRLATQQEAMALSSSNQVDALQRSFERGLESAKSSFAQQLELFREDGKRLATQQQAQTMTLSNQVAILHQAVNRERTLVQEIDHHRTVNQKLRSDYDVLAARHEQVLAQAAQLIKPPSLTIGVDGVRVSTVGRCLVVVFDEGLFDHGSHYKRGVKTRLEKVAKAIAQFPDPLHIRVVGYADDERPFLKWTAQWESTLALERASTVVNDLIKFGFFHPESISAATGSSSQRPFPRETISNRAKNRTITLLLTSQTRTSP